MYYVFQTNFHFIDKQFYILYKLEIIVLTCWIDEEQRIWWWTLKTWLPESLSLQGRHIFQMLPRSLQLQERALQLFEIINLIYSWITIKIIALHNLFVRQFENRTNLYLSLNNLSEHNLLQHKIFLKINRSKLHCELIRMDSVIQKVNQSFIYQSKWDKMVNLFVLPFISIRQQLTNYLSPNWDW